MAGPGKKAIPMATRRAVATRAAGGETPEHAPIFCSYCGEQGKFWWPRRDDGTPGAWVHFSLELDHIYPEALGGAGDPDNITLACRPCNRSKGTKIA